MLRRVLAPLIAASLALSACEGLELPFFSQPTPTPAARPSPPPAATPTPAPTPTPPPTVEVPRFHVAVVDPRTLSAAVAFRLKNPKSDEWLLGATATGALFTPDGRLIPLAKPTAPADLAPGEEKWFSFPSVDTFGSIVGKVNVTVAGGQWLPARAYPYPGGVPVAVARVPAPSPAPPPPPTPTPAPGATPAAPVVLTADFVVLNNGELGVNGVIRGYAFDDKGVFVGLLECPARLYPARADTRIGCAAVRPETLRGTRLEFAIYADLRPVLVLPTPAPATPSPSPTGR